MMNSTLVSGYENLHVSCVVDASNLAFLKEICVTGVLSLLSGTTEDYPNLSNAVTAAKADHCFIDIDDEGDADLLSRLRECLEFLKRHCKPAGQGALIHCHAGISRSAAVACAYLMVHNSPFANTTRFDSALKRIRKKRFAFPNDGFMKQLRIFEEVGCNESYSPDGDGDVNRLPLRSEFQHRLLMLRALLKRLQPLEKPRIPDQLFASNPFVQKPCSLVTYTCRHCRTTLASDRHIWRTEQNIIHVIPICWMRKPLEGNVKGRFVCPKCSAKVGSFNRLLRREACEDWSPCSLTLSSLDRRIVNNSLTKHHPPAPPLK